MAKIRVLSEGLVRKIAAGEVIERPASVAKELIENALDAEASRIDVDVRAGGRQGIAVADNGLGMARDDVLLCAERHATSKMQSPTDLFSIASLGFRGEALASIGAVSHMTIETQTGQAEEGTRLVIEGGIRRELGSIGRDVGTTVTVRNLFFNTPARRKFLRRMDTESRHITEAMVQLGAACPSVALRLVHEGNEVLRLDSTDQRTRAGELLGIGPDELLSVDLEESGVSVRGFTCPPGGCRRTRGKQLLVVRGRPIAPRGLGAAVGSGYGGLLPQGAHPVFVLWLDVDPRKVDVNVHPTKREVRFADERLVREALQSGVRKALSSPGSVSYSVSAGEASADVPTVSETGAAFVGGPIAQTPQSGWQVREVDQIALSLVAPGTPRIQPMSPEEEPAVPGDQLAAAQGTFQIHNKYIAAPLAEGIALIDQHAAHERIRYEEVLDAMDAQGFGSQRLLVPLTVELDPVEMSIFRGAEGLFAQLGFEVRELGPRTLIVDTIPSELRNWEDGAVFHQILGTVAEELEARSEARDAMAAAMACHTSIRAGEPLSLEEMRTLVGRLLDTREPYVCPHGRPTVVRILLSEMDRMFRRT